MRFAQFLQSRIFQPLGMANTLAREDGGAPVPNRAYGHSFVDGAWVRTDQSTTSAVLGDGGIYSSIADLAIPQQISLGELEQRGLLASAPPKSARMWDAWGRFAGALAAHLDYQRERVNSSGVAIKDDPYVMYAIGEAAADINAARQELLANADRIYDMVDAGKEVSFEDRAAGRRPNRAGGWPQPPVGR